MIDVAARGPFKVHSISADIAVVTLLTANDDRIALHADDLQQAQAIAAALPLAETCWLTLGRHRSVRDHDEITRWIADPDPARWLTTSPRPVVPAEVFSA